ncbi:hypothetical protein HHI36_019120 [Cryptolaemus montrouzieri]|uniref:Uncharacterized protein n=1 Tax=Cryptolaemus montrouzieri TaxID=559131 RepID=A0ABD2P275_9CUCU
MQTWISFMENLDAMLAQLPDSTGKDTRMPNDSLITGCSYMCISHTQRGHKSGGRPQADYEYMVLDEVENDAGTSVRAIEMNTGIPKSIAQHILKRHQYYQYHVQCVQTLLPQDYLSTMEFRRRK